MKGILKPIAAATLITLAACGAEKTSEEYMASANQFIASGDKEAAVIELKNALRQSTDNPQARTLLGNIYYEQGNFPFAEKEYARALATGADANFIVPKLALTYHKTSKHNELEKLAHKYTKLSSESAATLAAAQALSLLAQNKTKEAKELLSIAELKQSDNIYARLGQATLTASSSTEETRKESITTALTAVKEVLKVAPDTLEAQLLEGHFLMAQKQYEQAEEAFTKAAKLAPAAPQYLIYQVQSQLKQNKIEQAAPTVDKLLEIFPEHPTLHSFKARILYSEKEYSKALVHADKAIQNGSTNISTAVIAGMSALKVQQPEKAYHYLSQVQGHLPDNHLISRVYAYLQLQLGYTDEAIQTLDKLTELKDSDAALFSTATSKLAKTGDSEKALSYAEKAAALDKSGANTAKLGILKLSEEDDSGLDDLEQAIQTNPDLAEARLALVYSLLKEGEAEPARQAADDMVKANPDDPRGYSLKGLVEKRLNNPKTALKYFDQALAIVPNDAISLLSKATILLEMGKEQEAFELHKQNLQHNANKPHVVRAFLIHASKYKHHKEAAQLLEQEYQKAPTNTYLSWAYALTLTASKQQPKAIEILSKLTDKQQIPATRQLLGDLYLQTGKLNDAKQSYSAWLKIQPNALKAYHRMVIVNELLRDYPEALKYAQEGLKKFPDNQMFQLLEAKMLFENEQVYAAQSALKKLKSEVARHPVTINLKARIATHNKEYKQALPLWQELYTKQPNAQNLIDLASAYEQANQTQKSISLLEQDLDKYPISYMAHIKLAKHYMNSQPKKALSHYQSALAESPSNLIALNNASWLLTGQKRYDEAEEYAQKAYELSENNPTIGDTYGLALLRQNKLKKALPVLEAAYKGQSDNAEIAIHYAEALIKQGNKSRAKSILRITTPEKKELKEEKSKLMRKL